MSTAARQASSRRRITATTDIIAIIGTIATTGTIADGNARVSGRTIDAVMHETSWHFISLRLMAQAWTCTATEVVPILIRSAYYTQACGTSWRRDYRAPSLSARAQSVAELHEAQLALDQIGHDHQQTFAVGHDRRNRPDP